VADRGRDDARARARGGFIISTLARDIIAFHVLV